MSKAKNLKSISKNIDLEIKSINRQTMMHKMENIIKKSLLSENQVPNMEGDFEWPNTYWFIAERTNGRLAMIGFMAVIINYTLFGWIAYPIL